MFHMYPISVGHTSTLTRVFDVDEMFGPIGDFVAANRLDPPMFVVWIVAVRIQ